MHVIDGGNITLGAGVGADAPEHEDNDDNAERQFDSPRLGVGADAVKHDYSLEWYVYRPAPTAGQSNDKPRICGIFAARGS